MTKNRSVFFIIPQFICGLNYGNYAYLFHIFSETNTHESTLIPIILFLNFNNYYGY